MKYLKHLPNFFTLLNLLFGCIAIVYILKIDEGIIFVGSYDQLVIKFPPEIWLGSLFILLASIVDFFDGFVARWLSISSELGKQLDSLSDVVSFGVAPALIWYQFLNMSFARINGGLDFSVWFLFPAFLIAVSAAYRLGKFNLDTRQTNYFIGMPTPAMAIFTASLIPLIWNNTFSIAQYFYNIYLQYFLILLLAYLMNSDIQFFSLKSFSKKDLLNWKSILLALTIVVFFIFFPTLTIPILFLIYILVSILIHKKILRLTK